MLTSANPFNDVFICPEESGFYSHCLENLVFSRCQESEGIVEFGSGDGSPVISSLLRSQFKGTTYGFEVNRAAYKIAQDKIKQYNLTHKYILQNSCFFTSCEAKAQYLVSNPPYLPAEDDKLYQPQLHGGKDGSTIAQRLLSLNYENVMLMVSSYSNPVGLIHFAQEQGYAVSNFIISPLQFGYYSREPKVTNAIAQLRQANKAFYSSNIYLLAGVLFKKQHRLVVDISEELIKIITAL